MTSTVNRDEVAEILNVAASAVSSTMSRHRCPDHPDGIRPVGSEPGRSGRSIYQRGDVLHVAATRPGRGHRRA